MKTSSIGFELFKNIKSPAKGEERTLPELQYSLNFGKPFVVLKKISSKTQALEIYFYSEQNLVLQKLKDYLLRVSMTMLQCYLNSQIN